eukprot:jgi/Mesvir1/23483/Mv22331-RA.1
MAASQPLRKPVFTTIDQLRPETQGHNLLVKVISKHLVVQRPRPGGDGSQMRIAECIVGDKTGCIIFTARNNQVDVMEEGATIVLRNAKIDMFKGSMRLAVNKWGLVQKAEQSADFEANRENNLSSVEYELVTVVDDPQAPPPVPS